MKGQFFDQETYAEMIAEGDPVLYEVYEFKSPEVEGELLYGISIVHPGKVGNEYYMTKGHFHTVMDTAEAILLPARQRLHGDGNTGRGLGCRGTFPGQGFVCPAALGSPFGKFWKRGMTLSPILSTRPIPGMITKPLKCRVSANWSWKKMGVPEYMDNPRWQNSGREQMKPLKECKILVTPTSFGKGDPSP